MSAALVESVRVTVYLISYNPYERVFPWITSWEVLTEGFADKSIVVRAFLEESIRVKVQALVRVVWQLIVVIAGTERTSKRFKFVGKV